MTVLLNLTIKRRWFDMVASGFKREEYRRTDNAQVLGAYERMSGGGEGVMILRNGYRMESPALAVRLRAICLRSGDKAGHSEWGEPTLGGLHFVLILDKVLARGTYAEVRKEARSERDTALPVLRAH